jgi:hypothetical protein
MTKLMQVDRLKTFEVELMKEHKIQLELHRVQGEHDGRRNLPAVEDEIAPPQEGQIMAFYNTKKEELRSLVTQLLHDILDNVWRPAFIGLSSWSQDQADQDIQRGQIIRDRKIKELSEKHFDALKAIENDISYMKAKREVEAAENRLKAAANKVGRFELQQKIKPFWAIMTAIVIGLAEVPLNNQVFTILRDPNMLMTFLLSLSLVIVVPLTAHHTGRLLRQGSEQKVSYFIGAFLSALVVTLSYYVAELRFDAMKGAPEASIPFFFILNILFFTGGTIASFLAYDPSILLSTSHHALQKIQRKYASVLTKFEGEIRNEVLSFQQKKERIQFEFSAFEAEKNASKSTLSKRVHEATSAHNQVLKMGQGIERTLEALSHEVVLARRETNLTFRTNHAQPKSWKSPLPGLQLSLNNIEQLKWDGG